MSGPAEDFWNAWHTEPALRDLAERWLTMPDGQCLEESWELRRLTEHDPDRALKVIFCAAQLTTEPLMLANLAAGPMEDFPGRHGERHLEVFHTLALREQRLREVLDGVWQGSMPKRVWHRIEILPQRAFRCTRDRDFAGSSNGSLFPAIYLQRTQPPFTDLKMTATIL